MKGRRLSPRRDNRRTFSQNVDVFFFEGDEGGVADFVDFFVFGIEVGDLDQGIAHHHMVILIRASIECHHKDI